MSAHKPAPEHRFDWANPYPSTRTPVFARNVAATSQPLASSAGLMMMNRGGNAVDAAIACAAAISLTEPCSNGLGSDNFAIVWDGTRLHGLNASGTAPSTWTPEYFDQRYGADPAARPERGWDTVTVPGAVAGWAALHQRFGRLSFEEVLAPAIEYAERGFAVSPIVQDKWQRAAPLLTGIAGFDQHFLPRGRAPKVGEHFVLPGADRALKLIAKTRGEDFYRGQIAQAIVSFAGAGGGTLSLADLDRYRPIWVDTICQPFAGYELHEIPPNGQGIAALICLGILGHTELADCPVDSADWHHLTIEAIKLAFADAYAQVADPAAMRLTAAQMLDPEYLRQRARLIDRTRAQAFAPGKPPGGGTVYLTCADASGMMVSLIQSNYMGFGSGLVVPGFGVSLQNRGYGFSLDPSHPNCVAPGKRPFHTIIPAFLMRDGASQMSFGVMGGSMQPQGQVQTLTRMVLALQQPQSACDAPRWKWVSGVNLEVESSIPLKIAAELQSRGHRIVRGDDTYMDFGSGQMIWRLGDPGVDGYVAASDSRRDGQACGY
jgi:gamma-glutamyltranspeptidase / glutathione hydrolase